MREIARNSAAQNNGLHQTKGAEERPRHLVVGRSLRAPFAGEAGCWADLFRDCKEAAACPT